MSVSSLDALLKCQCRLDQEIASEEKQKDPLHLVVGSLKQKKKLIAREIQRLRAH